MQSQYNQAKAICATANLSSKELCAERPNMEQKYLRYVSDANIIPLRAELNVRGDAFS